jgi:transcriptional regulator with XRE-family HTH domain
MSTIDVGRRVRYFRQRAGLTQVELAQRLSIAQSAISSWERGDNPTFRNLEACADACGVTLHEFFGPIPDPPDELDYLDDLPNA